MIRFVLWLALSVMASMAHSETERLVYAMCPMKGDLCGYVDRDGSWITPQIFEVARAFPSGDSLARAKRNGSWGFIDKTGIEIIPFKYEAVSAFSDGVASFKRSGHWGLLDRTGREIVAPRFQERLELADGADHTVGRIDGVSYIIGKSGSILRSPQFEYISHIFSENLAIAKKDGKYGYIDSTGRTVIEFKFENAFEFRYGLARVQLNQSIVFINRQGEAVFKPMHAKVGVLSGGFIAIADANGKWGYIDMLGNEVVDQKYDEAKSFQDGRAAVSLNGKWGYIDTEGNEVIALRFDTANFFQFGLASVEIGGKWGILDHSGDWVSQPYWTSATPLDEYRIRVRFANGERSGLLDRNGVPVTFSFNDVMMAELQSSQRQDAAKLEDANAEIERLRDQAERSAVQSRVSEQRSTACDHVYVGKEFEARGGFLGLNQRYIVMGYSERSGLATIRGKYGDDYRQEVSCKAIP